MYNILPIYDSIAKQNFRKDYCYNDACCTFNLLTPPERLPTFQLTRPQDVSGINHVYLYDTTDTLISDIVANIPAGDLTYETNGSTDWISYFGNIDLLADLPCGTYYLKITDRYNTWYTELFTVKQFTIDTTFKILYNDTQVITVDDGTDDLIYK